MKDRERLSRPAFDLNATNACKGVALILLLWHHLFYKHPEFGPLVHTSALLAKVCVAMFVFLSGYGFAESVRARKFELLRFYRTRLVPLYANYWLIAALFVSLGVWVMGVSLESAYTDHPYGKFLVQMTGLHRYAFPEYGYNATWWYMSVIIPLVLLFPAFNAAVRRAGWWVPMVLLLLLLVKRPLIPVLNEWLLPFALGILFSQRSYFTAVHAWLSRWERWRHFGLLVVIALVMVFRTHSPVLGGTRIDWLLALLIIVLTSEWVRTHAWSQTALAYLGRHLFNVFLFHTFIYAYFWSEFIYGFGSPLLVFAVLLTICLVISEILELVKNHIGFHRGVRWLQGGVQRSA